MKENKSLDHSSVDLSNLLPKSAKTNKGFVCGNQAGWILIFILNSRILISRAMVWMWGRLLPLKSKEKQFWLSVNHNTKLFLFAKYSVRDSKDFLHLTIPLTHFPTLLRFLKIQNPQQARIGNQYYKQNFYDLTHLTLFLKIL